MRSRSFGVLNNYKTPQGIRYIKDQHPKKPYLLCSRYLYYSVRYDKHVQLMVGDRSDGATGAFDIQSLSWWVHDKLCITGQWEDGTKLTNWQCSRVLSDILWDEGRYFRSGYWLFATFFMGGGKARDNGMFKLKEI